MSKSKIKSKKFLAACDQLQLLQCKQHADAHQQQRGKAATE
jgi:hypothetical protein